MWPSVIVGASFSRAFKTVGRLEQFRKGDLEARKQRRFVGPTRGDQPDQSLLTAKREHRHRPLETIDDPVLLKPRFPILAPLFDIVALPVASAGGDKLDGN